MVDTVYYTALHYEFELWFIEPLHSIMRKPKMFSAHSKNIR